MYKIAFLGIAFLIIGTIGILLENKPIALSCAVAMGIITICISAKAMYELHNEPDNHKDKTDDS